MERRAADFRLDFKLREMCKRDISQLCSYEKESLDSVEGFDARVIVCLQDFRDELSDQECRNAVHAVIQRGSEDIRFDEPLADACFQDRKQFCQHVNAVCGVFLGGGKCWGDVACAFGRDAHCNAVDYIVHTYMFVHNVMHVCAYHVYLPIHTFIPFRTPPPLPHTPTTRVLHVSSAACKKTVKNSPLNAAQPCLTKKSAWQRTLTSNSPFVVHVLPKFKSSARACSMGMLV